MTTATNDELDRHGLPPSEPHVVTKPSVLDLHRENQALAARLAAAEARAEEARIDSEGVHLLFASERAAREKAEANARLCGETLLAHNAQWAERCDAAESALAAEREAHEETKRLLAETRETLALVLWGQPDHRVVVTREHRLTLPIPWQMESWTDPFNRDVGIRLTVPPEEEDRT